jgi:hypothetical protein
VTLVACCARDLGDKVKKACKNIKEEDHPWMAAFERAYFDDVLKAKVI